MLDSIKTLLGVIILIAVFIVLAVVGVVVAFIGYFLFWGLLGVCVVLMTIFLVWAFIQEWKEE